MAGLCFIGKNDKNKTFMSIIKKLYKLYIRKIFKIFVARGYWHFSSSKQLSSFLENLNNDYIP